MTFREFAHRKALIAQRLNIAVADVTTDEVLAYDAGEMEPMEACDWQRLPPATISSGPYTTAPGLTAGGRAYTLLSGTGRNTE
jgi:hypothetical protein